MTSGKATRRKRQAKVPPPPVRAPGQRRQASPEVLIAAAGVVALIVVAIVLGFLLTGGNSSSSSTPARGSVTNALPGAAEAQRLFAGIPQNGNVLGSHNAPVTVVQYIDLQCPFCQEFEAQAMPKLLARYVRNGKVKIEARPIAFIGPDSERGRAGCAGRRAAEPDVQLHAAPLPEPGDREHRLAQRRDGDLRGLEHSRPERPRLVERAQFVHRPGSVEPVRRPGERPTT